MKTPTMGQGLIDVHEVEVGSDEYHTIKAVSCSMIKSFIEDPQTCWEEYVAGISTRKENAGMRAGTALERLCFFDEAPNACIIPQEVLQQRRKPNSDEMTYAKSGPAWNEWQERTIAEHGADVMMLKQEEFNKTVTPLLMARDALREHEAAAKLIWGDGEPHVSIVGTDVSTGIELPVKMQLDMRHSRKIIVDLKIAAPSVMSGIGSLMNRVKDYGYFLQSWSYRHMMYAMTGEEWPFIFVFVSSESPFRVKVLELDPDWDTLAESIWRDGLSRLSKCWQSGVWQPDDYGRIIKLPMPRYAMTAWEDEIKARVSK